MPATEAPSRILHDAGDWLALAKPWGWETVDPAGRPSFTTRAREALGLPKLAPAHRLDRDTTGVVLFAKTPEALKRLEGWFRERRVSKTYLGLCMGVPRGRDGNICRPLSEWGGGRRPVRVVRGGGGLTATTRALRLWPEAAGRFGAAARDAASWLAFEPHEGRTHQIRVHAEAFGHPILGDDQYGDRDVNRTLKERFGLTRQALHAWRLVTPEGLAPGAPGSRIEAPIPEDFRLALEGLFPGLDWRERLRLELP